MSIKYTPHKYQRFATEHILKNLFCGLFLDMGLGKTVATLTALDILINVLSDEGKILVIAPKKVADNTWTTEAMKWQHTKHLTFSKIMGSENERIAGLRATADIYLINRDNVAWLVAWYGTRFPFKTVVIDELSSFKSHKSTRFKALKMVRPFMERVIGLTGTPMPNSLLDLWSELYLLDQGKRLGETISAYQNKFFKKGRRLGGENYAYDVVKEKENADILGEDINTKIIFDKIGDICISMAAKDYLDLPERMDITVPVILSPKVKKLYDDFEEAAVVEIFEGQDITAVNAAVLTGKLLQFANGAIYDENRKWHPLHEEKLDVLEELVEAANGEPVLIFYWYKHDLERILTRLKSYKPVELKGAKEIIAWNLGKIPVMLAHPASAGHGLNLQDGGYILIFYSQFYSLELYLQALKRLDRQGQTKPVRNYRLVAMGTIDEDAVKRLDKKENSQNGLMNAVKAIVNKYKK